MQETVVALSLPVAGAYGLDVRNSQRCWSFFHEAYCVTVVRAGHGRWRYRQRDADIAPHSLMLMEPGEVHSTTAVSAPGDFSALFFSPELVRDLLQTVAAKDAHFTLLGTTRPDLVQGFERACSLLGTDADPEDAREELSLALTRLFRHSSEVGAPLPKPPTTRVRKAARLLRERYENAPADTINIAEVSEQVGMTYHWLVHSFSREFGMPPYQYVQALRLSRLRQLLRWGPRAGLRRLEDIAAAVGFCDKSHLHRSVKRQYGISPWQLALELNQRWRGTRATADGDQRDNKSAR